MRRETRAKRGRGRSERFDRRKWGWGPKNVREPRLVTANECVARARTLDVTQENARVVGDDEALTRVCAFAGGDTGAARRGAEHQMVSSNKKPTKSTNIPERTYGIPEQPNSKEKECFRVFLKIFLEFANFTDCDVGIKDDDELDTAGYFPDFFRAAL